MVRLLPPFCLRNGQNKATKHEKPRNPSVPKLDDLKLIRACLNQMTPLIHMSVHDMNTRKVPCKIKGDKFFSICVWDAKISPNFSKLSKIKIKKVDMVQSLGECADLCLCPIDIDRGSQYLGISFEVESTTRL